MNNIMKTNEYNVMKAHIKNSEMLARYLYSKAQYEKEQKELFERFNDMLSKEHNLIMRVYVNSQYYDAYYFENKFYFITYSTIHSVDEIFIYKECDSRESALRECLEQARIDLFD